MAECKFCGRDKENRSDPACEGCSQRIPCVKIEHYHAVSSTEEGAEVDLFEQCDSCGGPYDLSEPDPDLCEAAPFIVNGPHLVCTCEAKFLILRKPSYEVIQ